MNLDAGSWSNLPPPVSRMGGHGEAPLPVWTHWR
jgi:hypothetical protein